jgi:spectrin alpha
MFLARRSALLQKSGTRRVLLEDSNCFQQFEHDYDKISENLKFATDDRYLDPTNLNDKVQKHQNFDQ